ncbi:MAG TPA: hypothetical protein VFR81_24065 [Longimicrobium sp.]|nr:hypothetical protein [Longimicrobium sp.]
MNKLRLGLDQLRVESFPTEEKKAGEGKGTVRGMAFTEVGRPGCDGGWTAADQDTCNAAVYTCPECASPPQTFDLCEFTADCD